MSYDLIMLKRILIVVVVLLMPSSLSAQYGIAPTTFVDGYVIQSDGDTLHGTLKWRLKYVENNPVEIKFAPIMGITQTFKASEIIGFGNYAKFFNEDIEMLAEMPLENYESMPSFKKGTPVFLNRLLDGRIKVFQNRSSSQVGGDKTVVTSKIDGITFSFSNSGGLVIGPSYRTSYEIIKGKTRFSSYFVTINNEALTKVKKENFDTVFSRLFEDCPEIQLEFEKNPDLREFKNLILVVEIYNQICTQ